MLSSSIPNELVKGLLPDASGDVSKYRVLTGYGCGQAMVEYQVPLKGVLTGPHDRYIDNELDRIEPSGWDIHALRRWLGGVDEHDSHLVRHATDQATDVDVFRSIRCRDVDRLARRLRRKHGIDRAAQELALRVQNFNANRKCESKCRR
jgi:hypothetical protein